MPDAEGRAPADAGRAAELRIGDRRLALPVRAGSEGETGIDLTGLRDAAGVLAYDAGLANTAVCESAITFVDGERGILRHRGYDIEDLAENCLFLEVAYLLIHGSLPDRGQMAEFSRLMNRHSLIHEDMRTFFRQYPEGAHPMAVLSAMVVSLSSFYPEIETQEGVEPLDMTVTRLLSKLRTIAAFSYKKSVGQPFVYPSHRLTYCENFLNMMFSSPVHDYRLDPVVVRALNLFLLLHADHEQNCSTSVVRFVGSTGSNLFASVSAAICALWGPLHGGANQAVIEMLDRIVREGGDVDETIRSAKDPGSPFRLMGFGHRVYKAYDPRARIAKAHCRRLLDRLGLRDDPVLEAAMRLEEKALADDFFRERNLYPNVDFYTGIAYRAMGIPANMFTVLFALGRLPGWIAHWLEMKASGRARIQRPRQIYTGPGRRDFIPMDRRV